MRDGRYRLRGVDAFACLALIVSWAGQAFALSVHNTNPVVRQTLAPGDVVQGSIELVNDGNQPVEVKAYLEDWRYASSGDGSKEFAPPQTMPRSCAGWISFYPQTIGLPPSERTSVEYTIRVPQDQPLEGGYYAVLFFEAALAEAPAEPPGSEVGADTHEAVVKFAARLGSLFLVDVKGTVRREARLSSAKVTPPSVAHPIKLEAVLANEGNVSLSCTNSYHIMGPDNVVVDRGELSALYLWPGDKAGLAAEASALLGTGTYQVVITSDCGEELIIAEETQLSVP
ncbi:MAG: hypothetical protein HY737_08035 [Candidatus Omnitrophica bacterium]|nr:hypothetical protein [Candidatus Omnitrophota bacterium]